MPLPGSLNTKSSATSWPTLKALRGGDINGRKAAQREPFCRLHWRMNWILKEQLQEEAYFADSPRCFLCLRCSLPDKVSHLALHRAASVPPSCHGAFPSIATLAADSVEARYRFLVRSPVGSGAVAVLRAASPFPVPRELLLSVLFHPWYRQKQLEDILVLAKQFHETTEPVSDWLSVTEKKLANSEPIGTQTAKIQQQISRHKVGTRAWMRAASGGGWHQVSL